MSNVIVKDNETLDSALRRFKRNCAKAGIQQEIRKREHYEKPSVRRKKKSEAARKRKYNECALKRKVSCIPFFFCACNVFSSKISFVRYSYRRDGRYCEKELWSEREKGICN